MGRPGVPPSSVWTAGREPIFRSSSQPLSQGDWHPQAARNVPPCAPMEPPPAPGTPPRPAATPMPMTVRTCTAIISSCSLSWPGPLPGKCSGRPVQHPLHHPHRVAPDPKPAQPPTGPVQSVSHHTSSSSSSSRQMPTTRQGQRQQRVQGKQGQGGGLPGNMVGCNIVGLTLFAVVDRYPSLLLHPNRAGLV